MINGGEAHGIERIPFDFSVGFLGIRPAQETWTVSTRLRPEDPHAGAESQPGELTIGPEGFGVGLFARVGYTRAPYSNRWVALNGSAQIEFGGLDFNSSTPDGYEVASHESPDRGENLFGLASLGAGVNFIRLDPFFPFASIMGTYGQMSHFAPGTSPSRPVDVGFEAGLEALVWQKRSPEGLVPTWRISWRRFGWEESAHALLMGFGARF